MYSPAPSSAIRVITRTGPGCDRAAGRTWPWARSLPSPFPTPCSKKGQGPHSTLFQTMPWASMWLLPSSRIMVRLRFHLPIADSDMACPLYDGISDSFGDHARVCPCGGDRVKRYNHLRNILAGRARAAGLQRKSRNRTCSLRGRSSRGAPKMDYSLVAMTVAQLMSGLPTGTFMALPLSMLRSVLACGKATLLLQLLMATKRVWITKFGSEPSWTRCRPVPLRACNSFPCGRNLRWRLGAHRFENVEVPLGRYRC